MQDLNRLFETLLEKDRISVEKISISSKVSRKGIEWYKNSLRSGEDLASIKVVKYRNEDRYTVLDGNHKAWALKETGMTKVECVVIKDPIGILYILTELGVFQPPSEFTDYVRIPVKRFGDNLRRYLETLIDLKY